MPEKKEVILRKLSVDETIKLAKDLISIRSLEGEETEVALFLADFMRDHGLRVRMFEVEPGRKQPLGVIRGHGDGPSLMFNGHMDVDPVACGSDYPGGNPWNGIIKNGLLYGNGTMNMKAGLAAMVMAGAIISESRLKLRGSLLIAPVVGELQGGVGTHFLIRKGIIPEMAVVPEPTNLEIRTLTAGMAQFLIHIYSKPRHIGSIVPVPTVNAIEKTTKVIGALAALNPTATNKIRFMYTPDGSLPGLPRLLIGGIIGGRGREYDLTRPSMVPDFCTIAIEVRFVVGMTTDSIMQDMRSVLESLRKEDPALAYEIEGPPATYRSPWNSMKLMIPACGTLKDDLIVRILEENHRRVTGVSPKIGPQTLSVSAVASGRSYAANDSGHLFSAGTKAVSYGPSSPEEDVFLHQNVPVGQISTCTKVLALTALQVCTNAKLKMSGCKVYRQTTSDSKYGEKKSKKRLSQIPRSSTRRTQPKVSIVGQTVLTKGPKAIPHSSSTNRSAMR